MFLIFPKRELMKLGAAYGHAESLFSLSDREFYHVGDTLSLWSAAGHIYHIGKVNSFCFDRILKLYEDKSPEILQKGSPTITGRLAMSAGRMRKGWTSPREFIAPDDIDRTQVRNAVIESKKLMAKVGEFLTELESLSGRLPHWEFGELKAVQWLRYARLHSWHHLKIAERAPKAPSEDDLRNQ